MEEEKQFLENLKLVVHCPPPEMSIYSFKAMLKMSSKDANNADLEQDYKPDLQVNLP
jgi:hypothetical protein